MAGGLAAGRDPHFVGEDALAILCACGSLEFSGTRYCDFDIGDTVVRLLVDTQRDQPSREKISSLERA
jgi:hypothetical protein